ncbi:MAG: hypothetical protein JCHSAcid_04220 [uncultured Acidilobus sp. JCHS]|nr:MAG: hypothetical protein JCHSAcid_04220 [uncultured Acidilobus sp. JCHS]
MRASLRPPPPEEILKDYIKVAYRALASAGSNGSP